MIVKTSQRSAAAWLAAHLTRTDANESVRIIDGRGVVELDVHAALRQFEAQWRISSSRARDFLLHAAISPAQPLSDLQWAEAWEIYERQLGLSGQPYIEVEHAKPGDTGRPNHRHRAYLRIRPDGRAVHLGHSFRANEVVARFCELRFGHSVTKGAHNRSVVNYLEQNGYVEEADQLRGLTVRQRPRAGRSEAEAQQESRSGSRKAAVAEIVASAWRLADGPLARRAALQEAGYTLAWGDRRNTVLAVDGNGEAWALHRLLAASERGAWTAALVRRDLDGVLDALPSVAELRSGRHEGAAQDGARQPCGKGRGSTGLPDAPPAEREVPAAPAPPLEDQADAYWFCPQSAGAPALPAPDVAGPGGEADIEDADTYWLIGPDDASPTQAPPDPAPVIGRLGADAAMPPDLDLAGTCGDADVEYAETAAAEPAESPAASPPPEAGAAAMTPQPDGPREPGLNVSLPPADARVGAPSTRRAAADRSKPAVETPSGSAAPGSYCAPAPNGRLPPTERIMDRTGGQRRRPGQMPADDRCPSRPSASHSPERWARLPLAPAWQERDGDWPQGLPHPSSAAQQDENRRRAAHADKTAARRIQDLMARKPLNAAPADGPPTPAEQDIAGQLRTYVGALLDWWDACLGRADDRIGDSLRRLEEAWRALVATTRLWLRRKRRSCAVEDVCDFLTPVVARDHAEARRAHDGWLARTYQPAAICVPRPERASDPAQRLRAHVAPRDGELRERTRDGE
ncbi:relaxase/mobilization nuclease domain-containing protein [Azospirillum sp.]|uniref:relaxase/mobilization nuclease domain-containing protein n=1 Tax=Azospirillum sp. TaxID=34012 RepID=UPI003D725044